jgi:hypothetical protein
MKHTLATFLSLSLVVLPMQSYGLVCSDVEVSTEELSNLSLMENGAATQQSPIYQKTSNAYKNLYREILTAQKVNRSDDLANSLRKCSERGFSVVALNWDQLSQQMSAEQAERFKTMMSAQTGTSVKDMIFYVGLGAAVVGGVILIGALATSTAVIWIPATGAVLLGAGSAAYLGVIASDAYKWARYELRAITQHRLSRETQEQIENLASSMASAQMNAIVGSNLQAGIKN